MKQNWIPFNDKFYVSPTDRENLDHPWLSIESESPLSFLSSQEVVPQWIQGGIKLHFDRMPLDTCLLHQEKNLYLYRQDTFPLAIERIWFDLDQIHACSVDNEWKKSLSPFSLVYQEAMDSFFYQKSLCFSKVDESFSYSSDEQGSMMIPYGGLWSADFQNIFQRYVGWDARGAMFLYQSDDLDPLKKAFVQKESLSNFIKEGGLSFDLGYQEDRYRYRSHHYHVSRKDFGKKIQVWFELVNSLNTH